MKKEFLKILTITLLFKGASCSFKKSQDAANKSISPLESSWIKDIDGDGIENLEESNLSTSPFVADIPEFRGEYFEEMIVTTHLFNLNTNKTTSLSFEVKRNQTSENGSPIEERDFLSKSTQFIFEQNSLIARKNDYKSSHHSSHLNIEDLGFYAAPRMNDLKIFPFSENLQEKLSNSEFDELVIYTSNRLNFSYMKQFDYSDLVYDLYWYNHQNQEMIKLGTSFLNGTYQFNRVYHVQLKFKTNDRELIREISLTGGRFLYLKLRDFKIIQNNTFYGQIIENVNQRCIGIATHDGSEEKIKYVASSNKFLKLEEILKLGLKEDYLISGGKINRIGRFGSETTLERSPYGENQTIKSIWHILTGEINNSPFQYSYSPGDVVTLNYLKESSNEGIIPKYFSSKINSNLPTHIKTIKIFSSDLQNIRINIAPKWVKSLHTATEKYLPCHDDNHQKYCWSYKSELKTLQGIQALPIMGLVELKINNSSFKLDDLINEKLAKFRIKNSEILEIKLLPSILSKFEETAGLTITFSISPKHSFSCDGKKSCESTDGQCQIFESSPPQCSDISKQGRYTIIDQLTHTSSPIQGEGFLSIEYL